MPDRHDMIPAIISAAIAAAGPLGSNEAAWKMKINDAIPHVAAMMNPPHEDGTGGSWQWRSALQVIDASVFVAEYVSHALEESSTRVVVQVDTGRPSKNYPDGIEPIRTHRTDTHAGKVMLARIERLEPGDEIVIWKAIESNDRGDEKYRTLVHLETRPKRRDSPDRRTSVPSEGEPVEPRQGPAAPAEGSGPHYTDEIDSERIVGWRHATTERLTDAQMDRLKRELGKKGYDFYGVSEIEWVNVVRPIIREIIE